MSTHEISTMKRATLPGRIAALWGVAGVVLLCTSAIVRLAPLAWEPIRTGELLWWHGLLYALSVVLMAYSEGYKGFQKAFAPRVVSRAAHLARDPRLLHALLAPFFCMALFHAPRRRKIVSWSITTGVILLIVLVRLTPQPWRGIIDAGVVVGLGWGVAAILAFALRTLMGAPPPAAPELPEPAAG
ncbi:MAG: hypothetical protein P1V51_00695 [Deltaproteobacteria bacterium]|nr:hypothetical protein [Deltaproteobacteria bacterium]